MNVSVSTTYSSGTPIVRRKSIFWIGKLVVACLVSIGVGHADAGQAAKPSTTTATTAAKKPAPKRVYSAKRSLSRKATLARARAVATAREMADTVVPRYKVDASGDLVPDLRAAAAIIY